MESKERPSRLTVYLPVTARIDLFQIAQDTGLSQSQLVVMATHSLLANYKAKGNAIFAELLNNNSNFNGNKSQMKE
ncbi:hypothetical protein [Paenibacillus zanthoxyli]|uniref:hypothetical protein n=1 Tax=Paenibacillus zanthoxyli TaxID=369399 RepID=UPI00047285DE|nr:hypothetical protein [Paenibacillus zanthoxyli]